MLSGQFQHTHFTFDNDRIGRYLYYRVAWFSSKRAGSGAVLNEITLSELRFRTVPSGGFVTPSTLVYGTGSTNAAVLQDGDTGTAFTGQFSYVTPPDERIFHGGWFEAAFATPTKIEELVVTNSTSTTGSPESIVVYGSNDPNARASQWTTVGTVAWDLLWAEIGLTWTNTETKTFTKSPSKQNVLFHKVLMESTQSVANGLNIGQLQFYETSGGTLIEGTMGGGPRGASLPDDELQPHEANNADLLGPKSYWSNGGLGASESGWAGVGYTPKDGFLQLITYNTNVAQELVLGCHSTAVVGMPTELDYYTSENGFDYTLRKSLTGMNTPVWMQSNVRTYDLT